jgi:hypothetical protein
MKELEQETVLNQSEIRQAGGGRKSAFEMIEGLDAAFLRMIAQHTASSPMDETVKWTNLTRQEIAEFLQSEGIEVNVTVVDQLFEKHQYRKRKAQKRPATGTHSQRNEQFENIERLRESYQAAGNPILSMDTRREN